MNRIEVMFQKWRQTCQNRLRVRIGKIRASSEQIHQKIWRSFFSQFVHQRRVVSKVRNDSRNSDLIIQRFSQSGFCQEKLGSVRKPGGVFSALQSEWVLAHVGVDGSQTLQRHSSLRHLHAWHQKNRQTATQHCNKRPVLHQWLWLATSSLPEHRQTAEESGNLCQF